MRYFSNSLSAWALAISAVFFPASWRMARSVAAMKRLTLFPVCHGHGHIALGHVLGDLLVKFALAEADFANALELFLEVFFAEDRAVVF